MEELDINPLFIHSYINSSQIHSSKLSQHSPEYKQELLIYSKVHLKSQMNRYDDILSNGEMLVIDKNPYMSMYKVMLVDGGIWYISYDYFDKEYDIGEIISKNVSGKSRRLCKEV